METIKQMFFWSFVVFLGLMMTAAGASYMENPNNHFFIGMAVLYSGMFVFVMGVIQLLRRDRDG
jgi:uncharacterized membrane protein HdeD (DUF308 family)|tara:strand:- start:417 stop:608 length:192 start_codon:yes stop_codon:yes gene_type:complete